MGKSEAKNAILNEFEKHFEIKETSPMSDKVNIFKIRLKEEYNE